MPMSHYLLGKGSAIIELHDAGLPSVDVGAAFRSEVRAIRRSNLRRLGHYGQASASQCGAFSVAAHMRACRITITCAGSAIFAPQAQRALRRTRTWSLKPHDASEGPYRTCWPALQQPTARAKLSSEALRHEESGPRCGAEASNGTASPAWLKGLDLSQRSERRRQQDDIMVELARASGRCRGSAHREPSNL